MFLLVPVVYVPAMRGGFVWDDNDYVTENRTLRSLDGLGRIWSDIRATPQYYPLVFTSFWLEYRLWDSRPAGYHVVNILFHATSAVLLWFVLRRLAVPGAWFAAAVFAVHPVHVESVAWITERKNVLSGVFYLAALLAYLRFVRLDSDPALAPRRRRSYAIALLLFACALLSKTVTASLPAALLLVLWWKRGRITRRDLFPLVPFFALGAVMGLLTAWVERHHVGAEGAEWALSAADRCLIAGRALWFYAAKLIWPARLTFIYPRWSIDSGVWWQYLYPITAVAVIGLLWGFRRRIGRGPLVAVLFFAVTLAPALGFFDVYPMRYSFVADHFQYHASLGPIALAAAVITLRLKAAESKGGQAGAVTRRPRSSAVVFLIPATCLAGLSVCTWRQAGIYRDLETLWTDTLAKNPSAWMAHYNLALIRDAQGRRDAAVAHYTEALRYQPAFAKAHYSLANALVGEGKLDEAVAPYTDALRAEPAWPEAHNNLALALAAQGRFEEAVAHYLEALRCKPAYAEAHNNLANVFAGQGRVDEAVRHYTEALRFEPGFAEAHNNLANVLAARGDLDGAIRHYAEALRIRPDYAEAHYNLGLAFHRQGRLDDAAAHYAEALRINPAYAEAHNNRANALAAAGRLEEALAHYAEALRLNPDFAEAHCNLADALTARGKLDDAARHYAEAIRLNPALAAAHKGLGVLLERRGDTDGAAREYREALRLDPGDAALRDRLDRDSAAPRPPSQR